MTPDEPEDPLMKPASDAGWDDAGPTVPGPAVPSAPSAPVSAAIPTVSAPSAPVESTKVVVEPPLVPASYDDNELRAAVGVPAKPLTTSSSASRSTRRAASQADDDDDDLGPRPRRRAAITVGVVSAIAGVAIAGFVLLGRYNSDRYVLACEADRAVAQQGRGFPPWGTRALDGDQWRPVKITAETACQARETDEPAELQRWYFALVIEQASALVTAREVTKLDDAESLLKQALLLTRPVEREAPQIAGERAERRKDVERLLGDVTYGRAAGKLRDAAAALGDAAKQFDSATAQHPRHATDAAAWADYARKLAQDLRAGPTGAARSLTDAPAQTGAPTTTAPTTTGSAATEPERPPAPPGVALPVEPTPMPTTPATPIPSNPSLPSGGVLL